MKIKNILSVLVLITVTLFNNNLSAGCNKPDGTKVPSFTPKVMEDVTSLSNSDLLKFKGSSNKIIYLDYAKFIQTHPGHASSWGLLGSTLTKSLKVVEGCHKDQIKYRIEGYYYLKDIFCCIRTEFKSIASCCSSKIVTRTQSNLDRTKTHENIHLKSHLEKIKEINKELKATFHEKYYETPDEAEKILAKFEKQVSDNWSIHRLQHKNHTHPSFSGVRSFAVKHQRASQLAGTKEGCAEVYNFTYPGLATLEAFKFNPNEEE